MCMQADKASNSICLVASPCTFCIACMPQLLPLQLQLRRHTVLLQASKKMAKLMTEARSALAGELDGKFPDALRNILFGDFGEDLYTRNAFRSAEVGMQTYKKLARCFGVKPSRKVRHRNVLLDAPLVSACTTCASEHSNVIVAVPVAVLVVGRGSFVVCDRAVWCRALA